MVRYVNRSASGRRFGVRGARRESVTSLAERVRSCNFASADSAAKPFAPILTRSGPTVSMSPS